MTAIKKTTITVTVLHPDDVDIGQMTLEELGGEMSHGEVIGLASTHSAEEIPDASVPDKLRQIGNDGTFYDAELATSQTLLNEQV